MRHLNILPLPPISLSTMKKRARGHQGRPGTLKTRSPVNLHRK